MPSRTPTRRGQRGRKRVSTAKAQSRPPARRSKAKAKAARRSDFSPWSRLRAGIREGLGRQADDVWGLVLTVTALLIALAFFDMAGPAGEVVGDSLGFLFGVWAYALPPCLAALGLTLVLAKRPDGAGRSAAGAIITYLGTLALFHLLTGTVSLAASIELVERRGGAVGSLLAYPLRRVIGFWGAFVLLAAVVAVGVLVLTKTSVHDLFHGIGTSIPKHRPVRIPGSVPPPKAERTRPRHLAEVKPKRPYAPRSKTGTAKPEARPPQRALKPRPATAASPTAKGYRLPPMDLLDFGGTEEHNRRALEDTAGELEDTLRQHGVDAQLTKIVPGPTVTRYEIELAPGVKVNKVTNLAHDIAYALATPDIRLLAPIPGRSAIGVEVPNRKRRLVSLGDVLRSSEAVAAAHPLEVGLGMDINGHPRMLNLADLPHLLIAGATGAGKSSCIHSIVASLLMRATPDDVRLMMVDPKRVELGHYNGVPHLLTRVITNPKKAADALKWAVAEMERRYDLLADAKARDIVSYREKLDGGQVDPAAFDRFPYLVVIIDELNDLMMVAGREVEEAIVRIAQMARAVGIHLVIATQRPSVDVITGVIKANIPSRLAFSVASQTDSRVIIDSIGAEKLVGMGDMLLSTAKEPRPQRIQGAWVRESEIHALVEWVKKQREAQYQDHMVEQAAAEAAARAEGGADDADEALIRQAMELIVRSQLGSTSMLQRKLRVGFARAGRIMDILERRGVVGASEGSKARAVLMTVEELEEVLTGRGV